MENTDQEETPLEDSSATSPTQCETAIGRVQWAIPLVKEHLNVCEALLVDLRLSTEAVCPPPKKTHTPCTTV